MKSMSFNTAVSFLAAVFLWPLAAALPAEPPLRVEPPASLSSSINLPRDRDVEVRVANVRELIAQQNYASAIGIVQSLLEENHSEFVPIEPDALDLSRERYASVPHALRRLLVTLPADAMRLYEQQVGRAASDEFESASRRGDLESLRQIGVRFPVTRAEVQALKFMASAALGSGRTQLATATAHQLLRHPLLDARDRPRIEMLLKAALRAEALKLGDNPPNQNTVGINESWRVNGLLSMDDSSLLSEAFQEHETQSIDILPRGKPIIRGNTICVRSLRHVSAYELLTGRELWTSRKSADDSAVMTSNLSLRDLVARSLGKQVQADSVLASLSGDSEFVITVEAMQPRMVVMPSESIMSRSNRIAQKTALQARRLTDGQPTWTFGGNGLLPHRSAADGSDFLGAPCFFDAELWGVAQSDSALLAYRLNRDNGQLQGAIKVGEASRGQAVDADWRSISSQVGVVGGELVLATNSGLIVAVDPIGRVPTWAVRYPREDAPPEYAQLVGSQQNTSRRRWWENWREGKLLAMGSQDRAAPKFVLASTDRREVSAFEIDGQLVWRRNIVDGVCVAGPRSSRLLVLTRHAVLILNADSGDVLTTLPIPTPTGEGDWLAIDSAKYGLPTARGMQVIDVSTLTLSDMSADNENPVSGSLVMTPRGVVYQSIDAVVLIPTATKPQPEAPVIPESSETVDSLHWAARKAQRANDRVIAFKTFVRLLELNPTGWKTVEELGPRRRVRFDRLVVGELIDLLAGGLERESNQEIQQRQQLHDIISAAHQQAVRSPDPFALQRFAQRFGQLPPARDVWLNRSSRIGLGYVPSSLPLLSMSKDDDVPLALGAAVELVELFRSRSYEDDARATVIAAPTPPVILPMNESLRASIESLERLRLSVADEPKSVWPITHPTVTEREMAQTNIAFKTLPVIAEEGSLLSRLDVSWHASGSIVRFIGDGRSGDWSLNLPTTRAFLRRADRLAHGWGIGHLLIVQLGTELFAITPFDENGEARARLLWSVDMAPAAEMHGHRLVPSRFGFTERDLQLLDAYDRPIGQVGPVQASYLCYQVEGRLVCLDTAAGQMLWERFDLPHDAVLSGDESSIFLTASGATTVLRAIDGKTSANWKLQETFNSEFVDQVGHWQLRKRPSENADGIDLRTGKVVWSRELSVGDVLFRADAHTLGCLAANGEVWFFSAATGKPLWPQADKGVRLQVPRPTRVEFITCIPNGVRYLLVVSGPRPHATVEAQFEAMMLRNPLVNGTLTAIERASGNVLWSHEVLESAVLLDQPHSVPFLMLMSSPTNRGGTLLELLDSRNGQEIFRRHSAAREGLPLIRPNSPQPWISLRSSNREVRIDYAP